MLFFQSYLLIMNAIGLLIMLIDKDNSVHHWQRIPEFMLITIAVTGGSAGIFLGMCLFKHKTRKKSFLIVVPICVVIHTYFLFLVM